jgi:hypothetical protein
LTGFTTPPPPTKELVTQQMEGTDGPRVGGCLGEENKFFVPARI